MRMTKRVIGLLAIMFMLGSAAAVWLSGWLLSGTINIGSGTKELKEDAWSLSGTGNANITKSFNLTNSDGEMVKKFYLTDNITSTDPLCIYQKNTDLKLYVKNGGQECELSEANPCSKTIASGFNSWNITSVFHANRCPLTGTFKVNLAD